MGFALSWIGVRGKSPDAVLNDLGWRRTGEREDVPESDAVCTQLRSGWFIVVLNNSLDAFDAIDPTDLSRGGDVVTCMVEEHVMVSGFSSWTDGRRVVTVGHDAEKGIQHLLVTGSLSPELKQIVDAAIRSQDTKDDGDADTDFIFDVPIDMAYRLTGFRHDHVELDGSIQMYDILEPLPGAKSAKGSWWRSLFRRRTND